MSNNSNLNNEIAEVNLSYLILAQQMIRADKTTALYRLGITDHVAQILSSLRPSQILKIAQAGSLVCHMRSADENIWKLLADHATADLTSGEQSATQLHARILQAGNHSEVIE